MRASYLVCAAALAFAAATLRGQPVPFSESRATAHHAGIRASTPLVTAEPGTVLTTVFVITNNSTDSLVVLGSLGGREVNVQPEYEDCLKAARKTGRPLKEIVQLAVREYFRKP